MARSTEKDGTRAVLKLVLRTRSSRASRRKKPSREGSRGLGLSTSRLDDAASTQGEDQKLIEMPRLPAFAFLGKPRASASHAFCRRSRRGAEDGQALLGIMPCHASPTLIEASIMGKDGSNIAA